MRAPTLGRGFRWNSQIKGTAKHEQHSHMCAEGPSHPVSAGGSRISPDQGTDEKPITMKLIIAGGRDYQMTPADEAKLDVLRPEITEVVSGCAPGADLWGERWAEKHGIPIKRFPADWENIAVVGAKVKKRPDGKLYNVMAGPMRNSRMAAYADAVALFPGGNGTDDMRRKASGRGLAIYEMATNKFTPSTKRSEVAALP